MEDLTKHQLILLVLLITFVTSIATGIITFTLLQEAPVEVTQTINRVVEKTIERVVTEPGEPEKIVTTVVVNEEDRVLEAISKNEKAIVRLKTMGADGTEIVAGLGLVVGNNGMIMADSRSYNSATAYSLSFHDGKTFPVGKVHIDSKNGLVFLKPSITAEPKYIFSASIMGDSDLLKIGQTIVAINGRDSNSVSIGRIKQLEMNDDKKTVAKIISDINVARVFPGSPIISLSGEIAGIESPSDDGATYSYLPINSFKEAIIAASKELAN